MLGRVRRHIPCVTEQTHDANNTSGNTLARFEQSRSVLRLLWSARDCGPALYSAQRDGLTRANLFFNPGKVLKDILQFVRDASVTNAMSAEEKTRHETLLKSNQRDRHQGGFEDEKKRLDSRRRESPILLQSSFELRIDWFCDVFSGGSRFKTWAGQQSVLEIASSMHKGLRQIESSDPVAIWNPVRDIGLPFNFDSDLGNQGSALDVVSALINSGQAHSLGSRHPADRG